MGKISARPAVTSASSDDVLGLIVGGVDKKITKANLFTGSGPYVTVGFSDADYICDGVADDVQIQAAIDYVKDQGGGTVYIKPGTYIVSASINMGTAAYSDISIRGAGRGATILQASVNNVSLLAFGTGDAGAGIIVSNIKVADMTFDMNNKTGAAYGLVLACCVDSVVDNIHIKNQKDGAKSMLFWGCTSGASSSMVTRDLTVSNSIFSDSDAQWESVTLAQGFNAKFVGCTFRDKTAIYCFLNYGSHDVAVNGCQFDNCSNATNGYTGNTVFSGCSFNKARITIQGNNTSVIGCQFDALTSGTGAPGINILGYQQSGGEAGWDAPAADTSVSISNTKIIGCTFQEGNTATITAGAFTDTNGTHLSADDILIESCSFYNAYWQGIDVKANHLTIRDCTAWNSGQLGTGTVKYNYVFAGGRVIFSNNRSFDNQGVPTVVRDFFIDNQYSASALTTMDILLEDNDFTLGGIPYYYTGSTFTSTKPSNITLRGKNNKSINPDVRYDQGNITGSVTFSRVNGKVLSATLTGNITVTATAGVMINDQWVWELTQDGTGSRTITLPSNCKAANGGLTLSTTAASIDVITWYFDGVNWRECARSVGVQNYVDLTNTQSSIAGAKTFTSAGVFSNTSNPGLTIGTAGAGGYLKVGDATVKKLPGNYFSFSSDGVQGINNLTVGQDSPQTARNAYFKSTSTSNPTLEIQGTTSQTSALQYWTSSASVRSNVQTDGSLGLGTGSTAPNSLLQVAGPIATAYAAKTANYTVTATDSFLTGDCTSGNLTFTLPAAASIAGREYHFKRIDGSGNSVIIDGNASETIDGATTKTLTTQWSEISIVSDGTNWVIKNSMGTIT